MGLFDMFGVGGGRLAIQPQSPHVTAGGGLAGMVGFQGGSRAQQITNVTLKLVMDQTTTQMTEHGPRPSTQTRDVVPAHPIASAFTSTPGQVQQFPFDIRVPAGVPNTTPGQVKYRLVASADIDGEIDPGANVEIQVVGGASVSAPMPAMGTMPGVPAMGTQVVAQWQDGNWHPAVVVAMQNGMIGVDWVNPALGQSSWVYPSQIQSPAMTHSAPVPPPMMAAPFHPGIAHPQANVAAKAMHHQNGNGPAKAFDKHAGFDKHVGGPVAIGAHVFAQWHDGHWHPARVVAMQNGSIGVDWDDPKLGQSTWVQPHQIRSK